MSAYLSKVIATRYGAFSDREVGPFEPAMNVVFGPNETGKSTTTSLIGDVLFGWRNAHGVQNTYQPSHGERCGTLVFEDEGQQRMLTRQGSGPLEGATQLVSDIDEPTYQAMFSVTAEELASLRSVSDVTSRLLSASSGTAVSPAEAYEQIEERISAYTATTDGSDISVTALAQQLEEKRASLNEEAERTEALKAKAREWRELRKSRDDATSRIEGLNDELEELAALQAEARVAQERMEECNLEVADLRIERGSLAASLESDPSIAKLLEYPSAEEQAIEAQLDEFAAEQEKAARIQETAKENSAVSTASYEALLELGEQDESTMQTVRTKSSHLVVLVVPILAFLAAGIPLFIHGREINSLSFTSLGILLVVLAIISTIGAVAVMVRSGKDDSDLDRRRKDAQWVMLQDKKRLDSSTREIEELNGSIAEYMDSHGLASAQGSIRQARVLLEEARRVRNDTTATSQRIAAIDMRIEGLDKERSKLQRRNLQVMESLGVSGQTLERAIDDLIRQRTAQRSALLEVSESMSLRFGELSRELEAAREDRTLDVLKMEYQQILATLAVRKHELIELLLAKRMMEGSIAAWEGTSQPEVYDEASRLLAVMTGGRWVRVSVSAEGSILAEDAAGVAFRPYHLSLGTCQQLYLALRVALLLTSREIGRAIPVLCDDILVNFDRERRAGAALVLHELAQARQVITFTCHEETVDAVREASPNANIIELRAER